MYANKATEQAYWQRLNSAPEITVPVYTQIPNNAPDLYIWVLEADISAEEPNKTTFNFSVLQQIEVHSKGDSYNATRNKAHEVMGQIMTVLKPFKSTTLPMQGGWAMAMQAINRMQGDDTMFEAARVIRNIVIFDTLIIKTA